VDTKRSKELIDHALNERNFVYLANLVRDAKLSPEVRDYLAKIICGLLIGEISPAAHRPKRKKTEWEAMQIARDVLQLHRCEGWKKISAAVEKVAEDRGCKKSKKALSDHRAWAELDLNRHEFDDMIDLAWGGEARSCRRVA
jgi:hypothetical protein